MAAPTRAVPDGEFPELGIGMLAQEVMKPGAIPAGLVASRKETHECSLPEDRATMGMKTLRLSGCGEKLGTARSVHAASKGSGFRREPTAPWDRVGSPQFFTGSAVFGGCTRSST